MLSNLLLLHEYGYIACCMQVTNFYAVSNRYGTPDDFKRLVDEAHGNY